MPGFIKTKKDEKKWNDITKSLSKQKKKPKSQFSDRDWALANSIFHGKNKKKKKSVLVQAVEDMVDDCIIDQFGDTDNS